METLIPIMIWIFGGSGAGGAAVYYAVKKNARQAGWCAYASLACFSFAALNVLILFGLLKQHWS